MKKKIILTLVAIVLIFTLVYGGLKRKPVVEPASSLASVRVSVVENTVEDKFITYLGAVQTSSIEKISFKSSARLAELNAQAGDVLPAGTDFIKLDTSDLELELAASKGALSSAQSQYNQVQNGAKVQDISMLKNQLAKAEEQLAYLEKLHNDTSVLFDSGYASKKDLDDIVVRLNIARNDVSSAKANLEKAELGASNEDLGMASSQVAMARVGVEGKESLINDATYTTKDEKVVVDTMFKVGELVPAGYVVAVVRDVGKTLLIGVTSDDLDKIHLDDEIIVLKDDKEVKGRISKINEVPDKDTLLYSVEVNLAEDEFNLGEIVKCLLKVGTYEGMKLPLSSVMRDKIDYVYIVDDESKVKIKDVKILDSFDGFVIVSGLNSGDRVVVDGASKISENDEVVVYD